MTLLRPTLLLRRLVVIHEGGVAYNHTFHPGLNIIAGENGSGKSTIMEFIAYGLGAAPREWKAAARVCTWVFAEVLINGDAATLRREISSESRRPMDIYWGPYTEASDDAVEGWERYPYAATGNLESFSQVLFEALGIPEVRGELASRVTMHQVLRLVYADQVTPYDEVFRHDDFDSVLLRETVGNLLCGVYDRRLYEAQLEVRSKQEEKSTIRQQLRHTAELLRGVEAEELSPGILREMIENHRQELMELQRKVRKLEQQEDHPEQNDEEGAEGQLFELQEALAEQKARVTTLEQELADVSYNIEDSNEFVAALKERIEALEDSLAIEDALGEVAFRYCPACFAPLPEPTDSRCHVCKEEYGEEVRRPHLLRLRRELELQIRESEELQAQRESRRAELEALIPDEWAKVQALQTQFDGLAHRARTGLEERVGELYRQIGYAQRGIESLERDLKLAGRIEDLRAREQELAAEITALRADIEAREIAQEDRKSEAYSVIAKETLRLIRQDLPREESFEDAEQVTFQFGTNAIAVDREKAFAASSHVLLRNSFHFALLLASLSREYFRYPRLALFDGVEDKGMEPARSQNFQMIMRAQSEAAEAEHQIIMTTSMLAPELATEEFLIGKQYDHDHRTLRL